MQMLWDICSRVSFEKLSYKNVLHHSYNVKSFAILFYANYTMIINNYRKIILLHFDCCNINCFENIHIK